MVDMPAAGDYLAPRAPHTVDGRFAAGKYPAVQQLIVLAAHQRGMIEVEGQKIGEASRRQGGIGKTRGLGATLQRRTEQSAARGLTRRTGEHIAPLEHEPL